MSNAITLAAVTAVLKDLLENRLANDAIATSVGEVLITALPPDRVSVGSDERPQLNLFLYQVSQNRNADWVGRDRMANLSCESKRSSHPPLALDLHYLLTAYGAKDFQAELLLGHALQLLHDTPELTAEIVLKALERAASGGGYGVFSQAVESLSLKDLTKRLGPIRFSPEFFNMEETSKLWSSLQTHYRPSAAYKASMVLIERDQEEDSTVDTSRSPYTHPQIEQVHALKGSDYPITAGCTVLISGQGLEGEKTQLRFLGRSQLVEAKNVQGDQIRVVLPSTLRAGIQGVQVIHSSIDSSGKEQPALESNLAAFVLHPKIIVSVEQVQARKEGQCSAELKIQVKPKVEKHQRVLALLNETSGQNIGPLVIVGESRKSDSNELRFRVSNISPGTYGVQLQVDGAESFLEVPSNQAKDTQVDIHPSK